MGQTAGMYVRRTPTTLFYSVLLEYTVLEYCAALWVGLVCVAAVRGV